MFQAILCDDNEIILEGLSSQIKWKDLGIELTATAADGNEGPGTKSQHSDPDHQRLR